MKPAHIDNTIQTLATERDIHHDKDGPYGPPTGDHPTRSRNDYGLTKIHQPLMRATTGEIVQTSELAFFPQPMFAIDRTSAYTTKKFSTSDTGRIARGSLTHHDFITNITTGIPWENFILVFAPVLIFLTNETESITFPAITAITAFLSVKAFRASAAHYAIKQFPSTLHFGTSTIMSELMTRTLAIAVDDKDDIWDDYEKITSLIVNNNDHLHEHCPYYQDIDTDLRDKELLVLATLINDLDQKITHREEFLDSTTIDVEAIDELIVSPHEEHLDSILTQYGISNEQSRETAPPD